MEISSRRRLAAISLLLAATLAGCATNSPPQYSGFIQNVPPLVEEKDDFGTLYRYTVPKLASYRQVLLEPVQLYPEPEPSEYIDAATLRGIRSYLDQALRTKIATRGDLAYAPGARIARVRVAVTSVTAESAALKPYQYIPVALLVTAAKEAAGARAKDVKVYVELEVTNSVSGERLGVAIREGVADQLEGGSDQKITLALVRPLLERMSDGAARYLASTLSPY